MLFNIDAINDYAEFKPCKCGSSDISFSYWDTNWEEEIFVYCKKCGRHTVYITKPHNRTRLQDIDKVIEYWNHEQVINDG